MKKKLSLNKKTLKNLKLKLKAISQAKIAPAVNLAPSNTASC
jgi:hypothetical protein